ncbi:MAG: DNA ligase [Halopseudomonas sp.]|uniref:DNA ligase n=1 Tax=Halopseudomonas sp. TaxID=2901191 RepID=UPI00300272FC
MLHLRVFFIVLLLSGVSPLTLAQSSAHQPMLASVYAGEAEVSQYWVSEKLDGVRAHWDGKTLWSRGGYPIAAPAWFTRGWPTTAMDGELWLGRGTFDQLSGIVRRAEPDEAHWRQVRMMVFDLPQQGGSFTERVAEMRQLSALKLATLQPVPQFRVASADELDARLASLVAAGAEGLMLHHQDARYLPGRSAALLKYKAYDDAEAQVTGYTPGKGKYQGLVGALEVTDAAGRRFRLGSGLSDAQRASPPAIGSWVTYRYNGLTSTGLPRFARFLRVRQAIAGPQRPSDHPGHDG